MSDYVLRLVVDRLAPGARMAPLPAGINRAVYIAEGPAILGAEGSVACLAANSAWHGRTEATIRASAAGARLLRFELAAGSGDDGLASSEGVESRLCLATPLALDAAQPSLMRCDRVDFPPGGVAYTHTHQGPGIRCLHAGRIRIETAGSAHEYRPGEPWFETGHDPVYAATSETEPSHFIRVMILPRALQGQSSIRYVKPEDQQKPKRQSYQIFIDAPIVL